jgi:hypothetical protein
MSQIVHVVSMLDVIIRLGDRVFQSNEVSGAVCSGDFEFESRARGVNFCTLVSPWLADRVIELLGLNPLAGGKDHNRKWSPDVASRSHDFFS